MALFWIKLWLESLDDPKLTKLSLAERGAWWGLLSLAGKCNAGGKLETGGEALDMNDIADALHIRTPEEIQALHSMVSKLLQRGALSQNENHILTIVHWGDRQKVPKSSTPEAIADRVKRFRDKQREADPDKFIKGKYGHMAARTSGDVKRIKKRRQEIENFSSTEGDKSK